MGGPVARGTWVLQMDRWEGPSAHLTVVKFHPEKEGVRADRIGCGGEERGEVEAGGDGGAMQRGGCGRVRRSLGRRRERGPLPTLLGHLLALKGSPLSAGSFTPQRTSPLTPSLSSWLCCSPSLPVPVRACSPCHAHSLTPRPGCVRCGQGPLWVLGG